MNTAGPWWPTKSGNWRQEPHRYGRDCCVVTENQELTSNAVYTIESGKAKAEDVRALVHEANEVIHEIQEAARKVVDAVSLTSTVNNPAIYTQSSPGEGLSITALTARAASDRPAGCRRPFDQQLSIPD